MFKMKKILYSLIIIMAATFTACEDPGTDILYTEEYLELDAATTVTGSRTYSYLRVNDGVGVPSGFIVNLGAAHSASPINFTFEVDASSTAIENLHYTLSGTSGTIQANSSTAELPITILDDNINPGETPTLVINLTGGDVSINPNYATASHVMQVLCMSDLEGTYVTTSTGTSTDPCCPTETTVSSEVTLTAGSGEGTYSISDWSAGMYLEWYDVYGITADTDLSTTVSDVCNNVSIAETGEPFGNTFSAAGTVDEATGVITYTWLSGWGDTAEVIMTPK